MKPEKNKLSFLLGSALAVMASTAIADDLEPGPDLVDMHAGFDVTEAQLAELAGRSSEPLDLELDHNIDHIGDNMPTADQVMAGTGQEYYDATAIAAATIGYIPSGGVAEAPLRRLGEPLEAHGRLVVHGPASIITADTLSVGGIAIRMQGVRSPGENDSCTTSDGAAFDCDEWARINAGALLSSAEMSCAVTDVTDASGNRIGWCNAAFSHDDVRDYGHTAVRAGLLLPSNDAGGISYYRPALSEAQLVRRGIWAAEFIMHHPDSAREDPSSVDILDGYSRRVDHGSPVIVPFDSGGDIEEWDDAPALEMLDIPEMDDPEIDPEIHG